MGKWESKQSLHQCYHATHKHEGLGDKGPYSLLSVASLG